jgi:hypothetical protein
MVKPNYMTMENFEATKKINPDPVALLADVSHQLEEARHRIEALERANQDYRASLARAEGGRDGLKEILIELWDRKMRL